MSRPSFPAKLPATKNIAARAVNTWTTSQNSTQNTLVAAKASPNSPATQSTGIGLESSAVRQRMVDKLAAQGITDSALLHAMRTVERHRFVDTALVGQAYEDTSLPIGLGQTISKPNVVARMIELLLRGQALQAPASTQRAGSDLQQARSAGRDLQQGRVLEIGTGCGYQAAILAQLCSEVYSIERLRGLHDKARDNLRPYKIAHLHLLLGDGMLGYAKGAPYAGIIAAAGGDAIPPAWVEQLAIGGRIVAPMVTATGAQALVVLDKTPQGVTQTVLEAVHFVPLKSGVM
jgi:protein-L-isoaspartate(D-aspartate) O-methyltransferase